MFKKFCIVGTGPAGLYTAKYLFKYNKQSKIDLFEKLSTPLGLLKHGVAPDRPNIRNTATKLLEHKHRIFYNTQIGRDISIDVLLRYYDYCILACGAELPCEYKITGDVVNGIFNGIDIIYWYNNYPYINKRCIEYFDYLCKLEYKNIYIIGNGNVSLDIARILLLPKIILEDTDINKIALDYFNNLNINKINIIGRRGWVQSKFTNKELRELIESNYILPILDPNDYNNSLDYLSIKELNNSKINIKKQQLFQIMVNNWKLRNNTNKKIIHFHFLKTVHEIKSNNQINISSIILTKNTLHIDNNSIKNSSIISHSQTVPTYTQSTVISTPPEVQSTSLRPAVSSSNYLSLKSKATPGDRGSVYPEEQNLSTQKNEEFPPLRTESVNPEEQEFYPEERDIVNRPQVEPVADLREAKGQLNKKATTPSGNTSIGNLSDTTTTSNRVKKLVPLISISSDEYISLDCDLLIKCIGFENTYDTNELLLHVDNKRVFTCGWMKTIGKGDISNTIRDTLNLSLYLSSLNNIYVNINKDIVDLLKCQN